MHDLERIKAENDAAVSDDDWLRIYLDYGRKLDADGLHKEEITAREGFRRMRLQEITWLSRYNLTGICFGFLYLVALAALVLALRIDASYWLLPIAGSYGIYKLQQRYFENWRNDKLHYVKRMQVVDLLKAERGNNVAIQFRNLHYVNGELFIKNKM